MFMNEDETGDVSSSEDAAPKKTKKLKSKDSVKGKKVKKEAKSAKPSKDVKKVKKAPKVEAVEDGLVSLSTLSSELGITPATARRKLRLAGIERGEGRWKWKSESRDLQRVTKALMAGADA